MFVKTLRNMWFPVSFFNPLISALGLFVLPMATIYDHPVRASGVLHTNSPRTDPYIHNTGTHAHARTHSRTHILTFPQPNEPRCLPYTSVHACARARPLRTTSSR